MTALTPDLIRTGFGIEVADIRSLGGELDQTYRVDAADRARYTAKVYTDTALARWQHHLLDIVAAAPQVPAPRVIRTVTGDTLADVDGVGVGLYTWLTGSIVAHIGDHPPHLLRQWGAVAANLVTALAGAEHAGIRATHDWDTLRAPVAIARGLCSVRDEDHRRYADTALAWFDAVVPGRSDALPQAVTHHDLNDFNVLATTDAHGLHHISGVIDFTDAIYTARVTELAVAAAYAMLRKDDPVAAFLDVARGFTEIVPLTEDELRVLYPLAAIRLTLNAVTWTHRGNASGYGLARSQDTWSALRQVTDADPAVVEGRLHDTIKEHR